MKQVQDLGYKSEARRGLLFVFMAGVLWSTVGLGIRMIDEATVWQILLYRSISLSLFLAIVIYLRSSENLFTVVRAAGLPACIAGLALVGAYAGGIYGIQSTSVANAMLLFASAPFMAAILGWVFLGEKVRKATWIAILFAMLGIGIMVQDKSSRVSTFRKFSSVGIGVWVCSLYRRITLGTVRRNASCRIFIWNFCNFYNFKYLPTQRLVIPNFSK